MLALLSVCVEIIVLPTAKAEPTKTRSGRELALVVAPEVVDVDGIEFGDAARDNEGGCAETAILSTLKGHVVTVYNRKISYKLF